MEVQREAVRLSVPQAAGGGWSFRSFPHSGALFTLFAESAVFGGDDNEDARGSFSCCERNIGGLDILFSIDSLERLAIEGIWIIALSVISR